MKVIATNPGATGSTGRDAKDRQNNAARRTAERAVAHRDRLAATVSHDLRGPLQTILAWTHRMIEDRAPAAESVRAITEVIAAVRTGQLLDPK